MVSDLAQTEEVWIWQGLRRIEGDDSPPRFWFIAGDLDRRLPATVPGGVARRLRSPNKRVAIRGMPLAFGLVPGAATRGGRSPFFGLIASFVDPANSSLKRHNPRRSRSGM
jgi:hypothetical protein